jgi:transposase
MAHIHKKTKNGRPYYYVREIARIDGKPTVVNQVYLGTPERILEMATQGGGETERIQAQEFGALWLANQIAQEVDLCGIIDAVVEKGKKGSGPSVGEYFLYAVLNRMVDAKSKRALPDWYSSTAVQFIRPVDTDALSSQHYWKKWEKVGEDHIREISRRFFSRLREVEPSGSDCFLFDTTNYYTYMASETESDLARRGKNKEGKDWLRQVGVALLVSRANRLPLFYREYEGNRHDSQLFSRIREEMFSALAGEMGCRLTVVFDKGMNSEENIAAIDGDERFGFITTYSSFFAEELVQVPLEKFSPVDAGRMVREEDRILAWRTSGEYWGKQRAVVVTYNPLTATKQRHGFERRLLSLQSALFEIQSKVHRHLPHWRDRKEIIARCKELCLDLHLPADLYAVEVYEEKGKLRFNFRKNHYRIGRHINRFGKNIIVTSNLDWGTNQIVEASLDRAMVENAFRQSKDETLVGMNPIWHWTDSKIRCHILTCMMALSCLRLVEIRMERAGMKMSAEKVMGAMHRLHSCLLWNSRKKKPVRMIEEPDRDQARILKAFGHEVKNGVLQKAKR